MVIAYHVIFSAYGFWLPNDPRGSWSDFVRRWELIRFGKATKIDETHSVAHRAHDRERRLSAKRALTYPAVRLTGLQARAIARGIAKAVEEAKAGAQALGKEAQERADLYRDKLTGMGTEWADQAKTRSGEARDRASDLANQGKAG